MTEEQQAYVKLMEEIVRLRERDIVLHKALEAMSAVGDRRFQAACAAMQGFIAGDATGHYEDQYDLISKVAVIQADALLYVLNQT